MRSVSDFSRIYLYSGVIDFRKQAHALALVVQHVLEKSPLEEGALYVFVAKDRKKLRLLYWDKTGLAMWWKGLERDRFIVPKPNGNTIELSNEQLGLLLSGYDIFRIKPHEKVTYERYS